ncbi:MAG: hypothetical protein ACIARR_08975 [Phycisphaerales bacterium JB059]
MLKFLRKYNLVIMVIGGSLLMVVFLLQPILTRLAPDPGKRKVATVADGATITRADLSSAANDIAILNRFMPFLVSGMNLDPDNKDDHYFLLLREAHRSGLVGEPGDGLDWIPELAVEAARGVVAEPYIRQGYPPALVSQILNSPAQLQQIADTAAQLQPRLIENRSAIARGIGRGATEDRVDRALANARGITRLRSRYRSALRLSDRVAIAEASKDMDSAVADVITLPASIFADDTPEPTQEQLQAHFEQFAAEIPGSGDMGFGYRQPPSIKLAWLTLDPSAIAEAIQLDPVEVRKRYAQNRDEHPGEFAEEREAIETEMRNALVESIMVEADGIIRREVLVATRRLEEDPQGYKILPEDWADTRPRLTQIATTLADELSESQGFRIPIPEVTVRNADWLTSRDLSQLMPIGRAGIRVGAQPVRVYELPAIVRENETGFESPLKAQVGLPLVEFPGLDANGRRFYFTILAARPESPPDALDDVREEVLADVREKLAYERLLAEKDNLVQLAQADGLSAIEALFSTVEGEPELDDEGNPIEQQNFGPKVDDMVRLRRTTAQSLVRPRLLDSRLAQSSVLEPILEAAKQRLDPTAPIGALPQEDAIVAAEDPALRLLAIARLQAYRPMTIEEYRQRAGMLTGQVATSMLSEAVQEDDLDPFSFEALKNRLGYVRDKDSDSQG